MSRQRRPGSEKDSLRGWLEDLEKETSTDTLQMLDALDASLQEAHKEYVAAVLHYQQALENGGVALAERTKEIRAAEAARQKSLKEFWNRFEAQGGSGGSSGQQTDKNDGRIERKRRALDQEMVDIWSNSDIYRAATEPPPIFFPQVNLVSQCAKGLVALAEHGGRFRGVFRVLLGDLFNDIYHRVEIKSGKEHFVRRNTDFRPTQENSLTKIIPVFESVLQQEAHYRTLRYDLARFLFRQAAHAKAIKMHKNTLSYVAKRWQTAVLWFSFRRWRKNVRRLVNQRRGLQRLLQACSRVPGSVACTLTSIPMQRKSIARLFRSAFNNTPQKLLEARANAKRDGEGKSEDGTIGQDGPKKHVDPFTPTGVLFSPTQETAEREAIVDELLHKRRAVSMGHFKGGMEREMGAIVVADEGSSSTPNNTQNASEAGQPGSADSDGKQQSDAPVTSQGTQQSVGPAEGDGEQQAALGSSLAKTEESGSDTEVGDGALPVRSDGSIAASKVISSLDRDTRHELKDTTSELGKHIRAVSKEAVAKELAQQREQQQGKEDPSFSSALASKVDTERDEIQHSMQVQLRRGFLQPFLRHSLPPMSELLRWRVQLARTLLRRCRVAVSNQKRKCQRVKERIVEIESISQEEASKEGHYQSKLDQIRSKEEKEQAAIKDLQGDGRRAEATRVSQLLRACISSMSSMLKALCADVFAWQQRHPQDPTRLFRPDLLPHAVWTPLNASSLSRKDNEKGNGFDDCAGYLRHMQRDFLAGMAINAEECNADDAAQEGSEEWFKERMEELNITQQRLRSLSDADLVLLWVNYHLAHTYACLGDLLTSVYGNLHAAVPQSPGSTKSTPAVSPRQSPRNFHRNVKDSLDGDCTDPLSGADGTGDPRAGRRSYKKFELPDLLVGDDSDRPDPGIPDSSAQPSDSQRGGGLARMPLTTDGDVVRLLKQINLELQAEQQGLVDSHHHDQQNEDDAGKKNKGDDSDESVKLTRALSRQSSAGYSSTDDVFLSDDSDFEEFWSGADEETGYIRHGPSASADIPVRTGERAQDSPSHTRQDSSERSEPTDPEERHRQSPKPTLRSIPHRARSDSRHERSGSHGSISRKGRSNRRGRRSRSPSPSSRFVKVTPPASPTVRSGDKHSERSSESPVAQNRSKRTRTKRRKRRNPASSPNSLQSRWWRIVKQILSITAGRRVENFSTHLADCQVLFVLMARVAPEHTDLQLLKHIDLDARSRRLITVLHKALPDSKGLIHAHHITDSRHPDLICALICRLMINFPTLETKGVFWDGMHPFNTRKEALLCRFGRQSLQKDSARIKQAAATGRSANANEADSHLPVGAGLRAGTSAERKSDNLNEIGNRLLKQVGLLQPVDGRFEAYQTAVGPGAEDWDALHRRILSPIQPHRMRSRSRKVPPKRDDLSLPKTPHGYDTPTNKPERPKGAMLLALQHAEMPEELMGSFGPLLEVYHSFRLFVKELSVYQISPRVLKDCRVVCARVRAVIKRVEYVLSDVAARHALWTKIKQRIAAFSCHILLQRSRHRPLPMPDHAFERTTLHLSRFLLQPAPPHVITANRGRHKKHLDVSFLEAWKLPGGGLCAPSFLINVPQVLRMNARKQKGARIQPSGDESASRNSVLQCFEPLPANHMVDLAPGALELLVEYMCAVRVKKQELRQLFPSPRAVDVSRQSSFTDWKDVDPSSDRLTAPGAAPAGDSGDSSGNASSEEYSEDSVAESKSQEEARVHKRSWAGFGELSSSAAKMELGFQLYLIKRMLLLWYKQLDSTFRNYAQSDSSEAGRKRFETASTLNLMEAWQFLKDSRLAYRDRAGTTPMTSLKLKRAPAPSFVPPVSAAGHVTKGSHVAGAHSPQAVHDQNRLPAGGGQPISVHIDASLSTAERDILERTTSTTTSSQAPPPPPPSPPLGEPAGDDLQGLDALGSGVSGVPVEFSQRRGSLAGGSLYFSDMRPAGRAPEGGVLDPDVHPYYTSEDGLDAMSGGSGVPGSSGTQQQQQQQQQQHPGGVGSSGGSMYRPGRGDVGSVGAVPPRLSQAVQSSSFKRRTGASTGAAEGGSSAPSTPGTYVSRVRTSWSSSQVPQAVQNGFRAFRRGAPFVGGSHAVYLKPSWVRRLYVRTILSRLALQKGKDVEVSARQCAHMELGWSGWFEFLIRLAAVRPLSLREKRQVIALLRKDLQKAESMLPASQRKARSSSKKKKKKRKKVVNGNKDEVSDGALGESEGQIQDSIAFDTVSFTKEPESRYVQWSSMAELIPGHPKDPYALHRIFLDHKEQLRLPDIYANPHSMLSAAFSGRRGGAEGKTIGGDAQGDAQTKFVTSVNNFLSHVTFPLALRFYALLRLYVFPYAAKLDIGEFRNMLRRAQCVKVFRRHRHWLRRLFRCYSRSVSVRLSAIDGTQDDEWTNTMEFAEWVKLLKDARLLNQKTLDVKVAYSVFASIQHDEHVDGASSTQRAGPKSLLTPENKAGYKGKEEEGKTAFGMPPHPTGEGSPEKAAAVTGGAADTELIYPEFLEGLAAVAHIRYPDPYTPLDERIELFLVHHMKPWAKLKLRLQ